MNIRHAYCCTFGTITFEDNKQKIIFRDALINTGNKASGFWQTYLGGDLLLWKTLFSALFAKRMENISGNFRGIFADAIMLSFNGNRFFFAVAIPEGFLTLGSAPLSTGAALNDLYDNITTAREILNILKLN